MSQALIGIDEFKDGWKVVIKGVPSDFDIYAVFVNKSDSCVIEFDENQDQYLISNENERWSKQMAFERMRIVAEVIFGFIAPQTPCSMRLNADVQ